MPRRGVAKRGICRLELVPPPLLIRSAVETCYKSAKSAEMLMKYTVSKLSLRPFATTSNVRRWFKVIRRKRQSRVSLEAQHTNWADGEQAGHFLGRVSRRFDVRSDTDHHWGSPYIVCKCLFLAYWVKQRIVPLRSATVSRVLGHGFPGPLSFVYP